MNIKFDFSKAGIFTLTLFIGTWAFADHALQRAQVTSSSNQQCQGYGQIIYQAGATVGNPEHSSIPNYALPQVRTYPTNCGDVNEITVGISGLPPQNQMMPLTVIPDTTTQAAAIANLKTGTVPTDTGNTQVRIVPPAPTAQVNVQVDPTLQNSQTKMIANAGQQLTTVGNANSCLNQISSINSNCATAPTAVAGVSTSKPPVAISSCLSQVSVPGSHGYASEFMEKIVSAPNAKPPAIFGLSADLSGAAVKAGVQAMYVSKSIDGGKTWTQVSKLGPDKFDLDSDGLYNGLSVSSDGSSMVVTTKKGAFPITSSNGNFVVSDKAMDPASAKQTAVAGVAVSPDQQHMAVTYTGSYANKKGKAVPSAVVIFHKDATGSWVKDKTSTIPSSGGGMLLNPIYDPNGNLYIGTGEQAYQYDSGSNKFNEMDIILPVGATGKDGTAIKAPGKVTDVSVYAMTFNSSTDANGKTQYTPALAASCWGTFDLQAKTVSRARAFDVQANPKNPLQVVRTTDSGADYSTDGGKTWKKISGLPSCESSSNPGTVITASNPGCADVLDVKSGKIPATTTVNGKLVWHAKVDPNIYPAEFRTAHFNDDGSLILSGTAGTFLSNPFAASCQ